MLSTLLLIVSFAAGTLPPASADAGDADDALSRLSPFEADEVLWLARCIYSESDRPHEQELVAWVVRNRVETGYRGRGYRGVTLEPFQFSAFNSDTPRRRYLLGLDFDNGMRTWKRALEIALKIYRAPVSERPFPQTVRHFYSPVSMVGGKVPHWAKGQSPLSSRALGVSANRFLFFDDIDERQLASRDEEDVPGVSESGSTFRHFRSPGTRIRERMGSSGVLRPARPEVGGSRGTRK